MGVEAVGTSTQPRVGGESMVPSSQLRVSWTVQSARQIRTASSHHSLPVMGEMDPAALHVGTSNYLVAQHRHTPAVVHAGTALHSTAPQPNHPSQPASIKWPAWLHLNRP
jgi:hypothetical protein